MKKDGEYKKMQPFMEQLQAFVLFRNEGMTAVERMFPQHKSFVEANKDKHYQEVKQDLMNALHAA